MNITLVYFYSKIALFIKTLDFLIFFLKEYERPPYNNASLITVSGGRDSFLFSLTPAFIISDSSKSKFFQLIDLFNNNLISSRDELSNTILKLLKFLFIKLSLRSR